MKALRAMLFVVWSIAQVAFWGTMMFFINDNPENVGEFTGIGIGWFVVSAIWLAAVVFYELGE